MGVASAIHRELVNASTCSRGYLGKRMLTLPQPVPLDCSRGILLQPLGRRLALERCERGDYTLIEDAEGEGVVLAIPPARKVGHLVIQSNVEWFACSGGPTHL